MEDVRNRHRNSDAWWSLGKVTSQLCSGNILVMDGVWHLHGHALMNVPYDFDTLFDDKVKENIILSGLNVLTRRKHSSCEIVCLLKKLVLQLISTHY